MDLEKNQQQYNLIEDHDIEESPSPTCTPTVGDHMQELPSPANTPDLEDAAMEELLTPRQTPDLEENPEEIANNPFLTPVRLNAAEVEAARIAAGPPPLLRAFNAVRNEVYRGRRLSEISIESHEEHQSPVEFFSFLSIK